MVGSGPLFAFAALAATSSAASIQKQSPCLPDQQASCSSYTLIDTRGTTEPQGPSVGFKTMNKNILSSVPGGKEYDVVYPAAWDQNSTAGTQDIIDHIHKTLASNPKECFILEGYSQGAAAVVNAMPGITGKSFDAVKGVFLIGNPEHKAGLACNVDMDGGDSTKNVSGIEANLPGIPDNWVSKTLDVCNFGDGVCDTKHGDGITIEHLAYPNSASTQKMGTEFITKRLQ